MKRTLVLLVALLASPGLHASVDSVRQNFLDYYAAAGADRSAPRMQDALATLEAQTRQITTPGFLLSDGSWSDIDYRETPSGSWSPWDHFRRLTTMARAYRTPGQAYFNDPELRMQIESALAFVPSFYGVYTLPLGNWWFWTLGAPLDLGPTLVLMRGAISQPVFDDCVKTLSLHIGSWPAQKGLVGPTPVGENLVWSCFTHLCLALSKDDAVMLTAVRDALATACAPTAGDGIQVDSSFHQHGPQLYTGGYGGSFAYDVSRLTLILRNSEFALPPAALTSFSNYLADGIAWSLYGNYFDVSVVGREVARSSTSGINGVAALVQASRFDSPRAVEIRAAAAAALQSWHWPLSPELAALATMAEAQSAAWPSGHQHYYTSDYSVHRRPGWFASVKMFSARTKSGENTNGENILGSRQSDGRFHLVLRGDEYFGSDVWPALDWARLPGITVEQKADTANDTYGFGTRLFAGGTGDGRNGVSAMDVAPLNSVLTAKKSWFFFDDSIVFLTAGITSPSFNRVETVIEQWPLRDPAAPVTRSGNWIAADGVGYYVYPQNARLNVTTANRSGTWASLGGSTDATPHSATFLTLWLDHGASPVNADASYAIVPNATAQSMASWLPPSIVANSTSASAVRSGNATGVVFWMPHATAAGFSADAPAVLFATTPAATTLRVSVADPTNGSGSFHVTVPGAWVTGDVPYVVTARATTLTIQRANGATTTVNLVPAPTRRRSARH